MLSLRRAGSVSPQSTMPLSAQQGGQASKHLHRLGCGPGRRLSGPIVCSRAPLFPGEGCPSCRARSGLQGRERAPGLPFQAPTQRSARNRLPSMPAPQCRWHGLPSLCPLARRGEPSLALPGSLLPLPRSSVQAPFHPRSHGPCLARARSCLSWKCHRCPVCIPLLLGVTACTPDALPRHVAMASFPQPVARPYAHLVHQGHKQKERGRRLPCRRRQPDSPPHTASPALPLIPLFSSLTNGLKCFAEALGAETRCTAFVWEISCYRKELSGPPGAISLSQTTHRALHSAPVPFTSRTLIIPPSSLPPDLASALAQSPFLHLGGCAGCCTVPARTWPLRSRHLRPAPHLARRDGDRCPLP